jgi:hypothetical protein
MDDDIDAAELLHHGARDSGAAFRRGDIRSHEQGVRPAASARRADGELAVSLAECQTHTN